MTRRYYHPDLPASGGLIQLSESETQHAVRVMRVQIGEEIELFDGNGCQATAVVREITKRTCTCEASGPEAIDREPQCSLHLGIALPKPDRSRELIERLTELGVKSVTPLIAARTQRPPSASLLERLHRGSIEACKQSGRNLPPQIDQPISTGDFFSFADDSMTRWITHPSGRFIGEAKPAGDHLVCAIGPEGGFTDEELNLATAAGFTLIGLGKRILRVETAAALVASRLLD